MLVLRRSLAAGALLSSVAFFPAHAQEVRLVGDERSAVVSAVRERATQDYPRLRGVRYGSVTAVGLGRDWAVFDGIPLHSNGSDRTHCDDDIGDGNVRALLKRMGGRWTVVDYGSCFTDHWWGNWPVRFGAPASRSQYMESYRFPMRTHVQDSDDGYLALRSAPSVRSGSRIAQMPEGSEVVVTGCQQELEQIGGGYGRWCSVQFGRQRGWAFSRYLTFY